MSASLAVWYTKSGFVLYNIQHLTHDGDQKYYCNTNTKAVNINSSSWIISTWQTSASENTLVSRSFFRRNISSN